MRVSVVIPCHNEEMNVRPLIEGIRTHYGDYLHEIIPVDDNSRDGTADVLRALAAEDPRIKPVFRAPPNGVGRAIADGLRAATGAWVLSMDCDFQHLLPELRDMFDVHRAPAPERRQTPPPAGPGPRRERGPSRPWPPDRPP